MGYTSNEIKSFHPLNIAIDAVFYEEDLEDCLLRIPVLGIAVYDSVRYSGEMGNGFDKEISREKGLMDYVSFTPLGDEFDIDSSAFNLLGHEIKGENKDWTSDIAAYLKRKDRQKK